MNKVPACLAILMTIRLLCSTGCQEQSSPDGKQPIHPVCGTLLVNDRPAANARLALHPAKGTTLSELRPVGICSPDGSFRLTTYQMDDGAPQGEYVVTIFWPNDAMPADECECIDPIIHDRLAGSYIDPARSTLRAKVLPRENSIVLRVSVAAVGWNLPRRSAIMEGERFLKPKSN